MNTAEWTNIIFVTIYDCLKLHVESPLALGETGNIYLNRVNPKNINNKRYQILYDIDYDIPVSNSQTIYNEANKIAITVTISDMGEIDELLSKTDKVDRTGDLVDILTNYLRLNNYWEQTCKELYGVKYHVNSVELFVSSNPESMPKSTMVRFNIYYQTMYATA
jgi:hypothetical protein